MATANGGWRPQSAIESATKPPLEDADLAVVVAAWPHMPEAVRVVILAMVKAASDGGRPLTECNCQCGPLESCSNPRTRS